MIEKVIREILEESATRRPSLTNLEGINRFLHSCPLWEARVEMHPVLGVLYWRCGRCGRWMLPYLPPPPLRTGERVKEEVKRKKELRGEELPGLAEKLSVSFSRLKGILEGLIQRGELIEVSDGLGRVKYVLPPKVSYVSIEEVPPEPEPSPKRGMRILEFLARVGVAELRRIVEKTGYSYDYTARALAEFLWRGWVEKLSMPAGRGRPRSVYHITEEGRKVIERRR